MPVTKECTNWRAKSGERQKVLKLIEIYPMIGALVEMTEVVIICHRNIVPHNSRAVLALHQRESPAPVVRWPAIPTHQEERMELHQALLQPPPTNSTGPASLVTMGILLWWGFCSGGDFARSRLQWGTTSIKRYLTAERWWWGYLVWARLVATLALYASQSYSGP
jgi:hypothetical protein